MMDESLFPTMHPGRCREMPAARRVVVRIAGDEIEIEVELTADDLADLGGFVGLIPRVFA